MLKLFFIVALMLAPLAKAQEKVILQLKWFHQFQFAGYYMAKEKGFYKEAGFDVEIRERDLKTSAISDVLEGRADFGIADSSIVVSRLNGDPVVIASTIYQSSPLVFISPKQANVTSPYELAGKKIMFQRNVDDASLVALLEMFGIHEADYQYVKHTFDDWAIVNGTTEVMSAYRSNQPFKYAAKDIDINIVDPASYGIDFYGDLLFTTEKKVTQDIESVERFVNASRKGWQYALENIEETAQVLIKKYTPNSETESILKEAQVTKSLIKPTVVEIGNIYPDRFLRIANTYKELEMAPRNAMLEGLFLEDYIDKPYQIDESALYIIVTSLLFITVYSVIQARFNLRLKKNVLEKTQKLASSNEQLQHSIELLSLQKNHIEEAMHLAERANHSKSLFLANMSHEIRTPMNGIFGTLQLLQEMPLDDEAHELITKATYSSQMLLTIINDILDFSKIEARKLTLESRAFNLDEILDSIYASLKPLAEKKAISLHIVKGKKYHNGWWGDFVRTKQILLNLGSNAVKFTENGEVTIQADVNNQGSLVLTVKDSGIGMDKNAIKNLYNRFEQADNSTTRKFGGTGLGMAICKSLIDLMQGNISVISKPHYGTTFTVTLPLKPAEVAAKTKKTLNMAVPNLAGKTILLAEDNDVNRAIFCSMMKPTHADIITANNGQEAIDLCGEHNFDLIFMDIQMPIMDGLDAFKIIHKLYPNIGVIALTANVMENEVSLYLETGFLQHLGKPLNMRELYVCCQTYL